MTLSKKESTVAELKDTIECLESYCITGLSAIRAQAKAALLILERPDRDAQLIGAIDSLLVSIFDQVDLTESTVNTTAERHGCNYIDAAERRRMFPASSGTSIQ